MKISKASHHALLSIILLQLCHISLTATLPALNLTTIPIGLLAPNSTREHNNGFKPRAPDPYLAQANTETFLFYEYGDTPLEEATIVLLLYQMYMDYMKHMSDPSALVGTMKYAYTRDQVTLVVYPTARMTWDMFRNTWLALGDYQRDFETVEMDFDIHDEYVNVGRGELRLD